MIDLFADTICAISSPLGKGGVSLIRVSGTKAIEIVSLIFSRKNLGALESNKVVYGSIINKNTREVIDEVLLTIFREPKSYTMEDVIEISCHGGIVVTNLVLQEIINAGARLALPGEFTKRAYLNGRISLVEAESINDLINAKNELSVYLSNNRKGFVDTLNSYYISLIEINASLEVKIDYPEFFESLDSDTDIYSIKQKVISINEKIKVEIKNSLKKKIIRDGVNCAIVGSPNVGKSSLLNSFLGFNKALVSNLPGTTRDIVEGSIAYKGFSFNFFDTAGIRNTKNQIEELGINKTNEMIENSDIILFVRENKVSKNDFLIKNKIKNLNYIEIINKADLFTSRDEKDALYVSAINNTGTLEILDLIIKKANLFEVKDKIKYINNERVSNLLYLIGDNLDEIIKLIDSNQNLDMIILELKDSLHKFEEILGTNFVEDTFSNIFKNFCVGK
ncbi:MAG: tRNA uridine-5-carboxymethylaminomethyl(34) synthesis GTPase MnmE [Acholeplasmatales bacterium]|jgi:tRNA modification GTPase|nr:tRNA uridine-5-carboxymethylaminomethyl(34) synthesis GTPase MnmE [Acholeplasmatales bacterium]